MSRARGIKIGPRYQGWVLSGTLRQKSPDKLSETRADRWAMFTRWGMRCKARDRPGMRLPKYMNKLKIKLIIQLSEKIALTVRGELLSLPSCTHDHEFVSHLIY